MNEPFISVQQVSKFHDARRVCALSQVSFQLGRGEVVAIVGPSGCGKSSLLSLLGLLDQPDQGRLLMDGEDLSLIADPYAYRAHKVGFIFQFHHLLPIMTLHENIESPMLPLGIPAKDRERQVKLLLNSMGLEHRASFFPAEVSGGERQRAAVARAMANNPPLLLADEPTGNLDSHGGERVMGYFLSQAREKKMTVLLVTHNPDIARMADRIIHMQDGKIKDESQA